MSALHLIFEFLVLTFLTCFEPAEQQITWENVNKMIHTNIQEGAITTGSKLPDYNSYKIFIILRSCLPK